MISLPSTLFFINAPFSLPHIASLLPRHERLIRKPESIIRAFRCSHLHDHFPDNWFFATTTAGTSCNDGVFLRYNSEARRRWMRAKDKSDFAARLTARTNYESSVARWWYALFFILSVCFSLTQQCKCTSDLVFLLSFLRNFVLNRLLLLQNCQ